MRNILVLCLALMIALSLGCSKKEEAAKTGTPQPGMTAGAGEAAPSRPVIDPVSMEKIDPRTAQYSFEYGGTVYMFSSAENMEAFKADPEKYIAKMQEALEPPSPITQ
jgi:YHS domain-containing protein